MNQSNARFVFEGNQLAEFELAMRLVFLSTWRTSAAGWSVSAKHGFTLYWHVDSGYRDADAPMPRYWAAYPDINHEKSALDVDECIDVVWRWLKEKAQYGEEPDIDGSCTRGFIFERDDYGHAGGSHYGFISVKPCWAEHHK